MRFDHPAKSEVPPEFKEDFIKSWKGSEEEVVGKIIEMIVEKENINRSWWIANSLELDKHVLEFTLKS